MNESVFVIAHVDERGVKAGHQLSHLRQIDVAHGIRHVAVFFLERDESGIFEQCYRSFLLLDVYY